MRRLLANEGLQVIEADCGQAAIDRLSQETPDLIVLDLVMPDMDGFEVLDRLRVSPEWRQIPVVVVTAKELSAEERTMLTGSVGRVLRKTFVGCEELRAGRSRLRAVADAPPGERVIPWPPSCSSKTTKRTGTCCPAASNGAATPSRSRRTAGTA